MISINRATQGFKADVHILSTRRLCTWRFLQVLLILLLSIVVTLDLATRLNRKQGTGVKYIRLPHERQKQQFEAFYDDDDNDFSSKSPMESLRRPERPKGGNIYGKSSKAGPKMRTIAKQDLPPEMDPNWTSEDDRVLVSRFPKALLVGFSKCGTSALLAFLNLHPYIVSLDWEIDYFCERVYFKYSLHWYRLRMPPSTSKQVTIEKSPCYGTDPLALDRIKTFNASIKLMVIVRNPITRIISQHSQYLASSKAFGKKALSLEERYTKPDGRLSESYLMKWGTYHDRMERIYAKFPRRQVLVVDGDLFIKNPLPVLKQIERHLEVPSFFSEKDIYLDPQKGFHCPRKRATMEAMCMSTNKGRHHVTPSDEFRTKVLKFIRPYSLRFFDLVGQKFNWTL